MKYNPILAILALLFGIGGAIGAYGLSGISAELVTNGSITLVASLLGLIGVYLFEKDYKLAIIQYIICGLGVLIGTSLFGLLGCIFYIAAAIMAYVEKDKSGSKADNMFDDMHFFGDERQIRQKYPNFPTNKAKTTIYYIIPIMTIILIILVGVLGDMSYQNDLQNKADSIQLTNVSSDLKVNYGYYSGGVQGTLSSERDIEHVQIKGVWYSADGSQLDQTYDSNIMTDMKAGQKYQLNIPYYKESTNVPAKVEIQVYDNIGGNPLFTKTVNFN